jgi:predicted transcriptional regulator
VIGETLKWFRLNVAHHSQAETARSLNVSQYAISLLERGRIRKLRPTHWTALDEYLKRFGWSLKALMNRNSVGR